MSDLRLSFQRYSRFNSGYTPEDLHFEAKVMEVDRWWMVQMIESFSRLGDFQVNQPLIFQSVTCRGGQHAKVLKDVSPGLQSRIPGN